MKMSNYIIAFVAVIFAVFILYNYVTQRSSAYNRTNTEYANSLTAACHDAAKTINIDNLESNEGVWRTKDEMYHTLNIFYETLSRNFGESGEMLADTMKEKTPIVVLVDTDGFYINFNAAFDDYNNAIVSNAYEEANVITDINTWTDMCGSYIIRYYLSDYIQVTTSNGTVYAGDRHNVYKALTNAAALSSDITFIADDDKFNEYRNVTVAKKLEEQLNYFLNTQYINVNEHFTGYNITIPALSGEEWARIVKSPTIISFMQGNQEALNGNMLNVYAYASGELTAKHLYFIDGDYYYRLDGNSVVTNTTTMTINGTTTTITEYLFNGTPITRFYTSMEECAAAGAVPAPSEY